MDKTQIDERLARLRARAADVLGEPPDTSDAGGLQQVERAIQVVEAAAFRSTLISDLLRHVAELLCYPDDDNHDAEQHPGSRRGGCYPAEVHYVVRLPVAHGATYREVVQEHGTLAWSVHEISAEEAARNTRP